MMLLLDVGNTRLKYALADGTQLQPAVAATHGGRIDDVDFDALWRDLPDVGAVFVASVAGAAIEQRLLGSLRRRFGIGARLVASPAEACGVRNAYAEPQRLGVDRFLGLVALHAQQAGDCVLASCGTALTLDALARDGAHLGGLIAASPMLMQDALTGATARLKAPRAARVVEFADNTDDAIESGVWLSAAALVERFVARAAARFGNPPALVLSGGGAERLSPLVAPAHRLDGDLVLRGLALYAQSMA
jgi:type III pantothenate kinase